MKRLIAIGLALFLVASATAEEISWSVPEDGGTPRDASRIERVGPGEFRIRAAFEEGGPIVLRHAVSRVDLICRNDGSQAAPVTVHLDLSGDAQRTDYDNKPEAGMALRDFIFIQSPGQDWRQINGSTNGWIASVKFIAEPGETRLGLSPWYPYADYLRFVNALPNHPHLEKKLAGKSDGGREHWELTITDPTSDAKNKRTIFWHAREHAYETWSSFAVEGLVRFLLSDVAAEFRRRYIIVLHPMTNVDGVAQGFEYRGGYDFPDPRRTATGRLTTETIDRLRPDFAVAWHNWVAPRDRNVVFYTDGEDGKATPRAWLRFTQLFPSLRAAGHRWKDESTPLRYNWEGRRPLSDANPHQYAMKRYGTRVWGWEMPWWNYSVADARTLGASFGRAFLTTLDEIQSGSVPLAAGQAPVEVLRWEMHEFIVSGRAQVENPFRDAALVGEFLSPSGKMKVVDGFHDGGATWRLRFAPDEEGQWSYLLRGEGVEILQRGELACTKPRTRGFIRVHPMNPYSSAHADGTAFFPMGDTCYGLYDDSPITTQLREEYLKVRRSQGFNFVRMTVGHSEQRTSKDPAFWAWGGTSQKPDLDRFNPVFFRGLDDLFRQLRGQGMNVELILLNFYRRPFTDTNIWTPARERMWIRYVTSRYAAFDNVFLWTIANEYETHPDGRYRLDFPDDVEWAKATARLIKEVDPWQHPVTVHPVISASRRGESPRAPFDPPWRIGEFFGNEQAIDVLSQQTGQSGEGTAWDDSLQCWTGDSTTLVASLRADRRFNKPVLNTENGYEYLRGNPTGKKQVHHTDKVRHSSWRIVCAGGYFAAGFHGTLGHSDAWNRIDAPNHYPFIVKDEGAAANLRFLYDFFTALPFWRMHPFNGVTDDVVALAEPGNIYVVYLPKGGATTIDLSDVPGQFKGRWFDPRSGKFAGDFTLEGSSKPKIEAPDVRDWALLLMK
jgi:Protein of unknown function (DUF4038)/Domain of unknown function (DUF5060)/Zinc carboxypeptidase/Putative collagen-binding domain of a collagenase